MASPYSIVSPRKSSSAQLINGASLGVTAVTVYPNSAVISFDEECS